MLLKKGMLSACHRELIADRRIPIYQAQAFYKGVGGAYRADPPQFYVEPYHSKSFTVHRMMSPTQPTWKPS